MAKCKGLMGSAVKGLIRLKGDWTIRQQSCSDHKQI